LEDQGVDGRMWSEWILLGRLAGGMYNGSSWLMIRIGSGLLWIRRWTDVFWLRGIS
jgi:hypothetical protein